MKRTLAEFGELWPAEQKLREEVHTGHLVIISDTLPPEDAPHAVRIRASFIAYLALGGCEDCHPSPRGLRLFGAFIEGDDPTPEAETPGMDLSGCALAGDLWLIACRIPDVVVLRGSSVQSLGLNRCHLANGLQADRLHATGSVFLRYLISKDEVFVSGATLGGDLNCKGAQFQAGKTGDALAADRLQVAGSFFFKGATANGEVRLLGAKVGGNLDCGGAKLRAGKSGDALSADGLDARGDVILRGANIKGTVRLLGAELGGDLDSFGGRFVAGNNGTTLFADRMAAKGSAFLQSANSKGELRFDGAKLGGDLNCTEGQFTARDRGTALVADGLEVKGCVFLTRVTSTGTLKFAGAALGGDLDCTGGKFTAGGGRAALFAQALEAEGGFILRGDGIVAESLVLTNARVSAVIDDLHCWPAAGHLAFDGFRYDAIYSTALSAKERLEWLSRQCREGEPFKPQPYEQLAKVFRDMGHQDDARTVLIERERLQRLDRRQRVGRLKRIVLTVGDGLLAGTTGYGRAPFRAMLWLLGFLGLGWFLFQTAVDQDAIKPNNAVVLRSAEWAACSQDYLAGPEMPQLRWRSHDASQLACFERQPEAAAYPKFSAFWYSMDTLFPLVDLEMQTHWIPDEREADWARWYLWLHIIAGWGLSLLAVAGFSGLIKSD
ncbi:hypothetical protein AB0T83_00330 [Fluviibacterium sp. DFM31]|uniref:Membrane-associated oxidoreductase n=1 Tax=Meridianimarinicoccus marinus TaxID=3231483 RepID=A0ABV3L0Z7_9RHOB